MTFNISVMPFKPVNLDVLTGEAEGVFRIIRNLNPKDASDFNVSKSDNIVALLLKNIRYVTLAAMSASSALKIVQPFIPSHWNGCVCGNLMRWELLGPVGGDLTLWQSPVSRISIFIAGRRSLNIGIVKKWS